jgi:hypothetical protein
VAACALARLAHGPVACRWRRAVRLRLWFALTGRPGRLPVALPVETFLITKIGAQSVVAWNKRMLGYRGSAQASPALGDALKAGYRYLEVRCLGCDTHQTVALEIVGRPETRFKALWNVLEAEYLADGIADILLLR